jgi:hypothetical protein
MSTEAANRSEEGGVGREGPDTNDSAIDLGVIPSLRDRQEDSGSDSSLGDDVDWSLQEEEKGKEKGREEKGKEKGREKSREYEKRLTDIMFVREPSVAEFLRRCSTIRETLNLKADGGGSPRAARALLNKYRTQMGGSDVLGLATAADEGDFDLMEGLVLYNLLDYNLKDAHAAVRNVRQHDKESLRAYTRRVLDLWRGIERVELVDKRYLELSARADKAIAVRYWSFGIRLEELRSFVQGGVLDQSLIFGDISKIKDLSLRAQKVLDEADSIKDCFLLRLVPAPAKSKQHRYATAKAPTSQTVGETTRGGRGPVREPRQQRQTTTADQTTETNRRLAQYAKKQRLFVDVGV